jgi:hypothetical protein
LNFEAHDLSHFYETHRTTDWTVELKLCLMTEFVGYNTSY